MFKKIYLNIEKYVKFCCLLKRLHGIVRIISLKSLIMMKKLMKILSNPWIKIPFALTFLVGFIYFKLIAPIL
jgi:hypothetical protein